MPYVSMLLVFVLLAAWVVGGGSMVLSAFKTRGWPRVAKILGGFLMMVGATGFFGAALASMGAFNWLPPSFEWPVGKATGVVSTEDHYYIVPHDPVSRIQVYDQNWKFVRGWSVSAGGGSLHVYITDTNHIHLLARRNKHLVYDLNGRLLSEGFSDNHGDAYSSLPPGRTYMVPTPIFLWVFSGPFASWLTAGAGVLLLVAADKAGKTRKKPVPPVARKSISIDLPALKRLLSFEYVQAFKCDKPHSFTEHPVSSCGVPIHDQRFYLVSSRALMRFHQTPVQTMTFFPRNELLKDWDYDILALRLADKVVPVVLFFYTRQGRPASLDFEKLSATVTVSESKAA